MSASTKQTVLVFGATGNTGTSIMDGLLDYNKSKIIAVVRENSLSKPIVQGYKSRGAEIRTFDLDGEFHVEEVERLYRGVDVVIAAFRYTHVRLEYGLIDVARKVGVKRFVPCDWATACVKGVMSIFDVKLAVREYLQASGVGYTFIDVGWWMQLLLPLHKPELSMYPDIPRAGDWPKYRYANFKTRTAVTAKEDIGQFVARIIEDPRTLGRYIFCWSEEIDQETVIKTVDELSPVKVDWKHVPEEELMKLIEKGRREKNPLVIREEYMHSLWIREDNLIEKAEKAEYGGALDAKALYPQFEPKSFRRLAEEFYKR